jgi:hypothetical protein
VITPRTEFGDIRETKSMVQMGVRIPELHQARYEALLEQAESGRVGDLPVDDMPHPGKQKERYRYPPESMAAGKGIGFAGVTYLQGAERVLPEVLSLIRGADADLAWTKDWTPAELAYVQAQLTPRFTKEGLTAHAAVLFQPGGIKIEFYRPGRSGYEVISVFVSATHDGQPSALGRVGEATLEVMPSAYAGQSSDDTIGSALNANAGLRASAGLHDHNVLHGLGFLLQGSWARSVSATTTAGATGFSLQAMLYVGPARLFTYGNVSYQARVNIRHEKNVGPGLFQWLYHDVRDNKAAGTIGGVEAAKGALKAAAQALNPISPAKVPIVTSEPAVPAPPKVEATRAKTLPGSVQFILHENLARAVPPAGAAVRDVGAMTVETRFGAKHPSGKRTGPAGEVILPAVKKYLGDDGHVVVNADDQVMEVLSSDQLAKEVRDVLVRAGLDDDTIGDMPHTLTEPAHLAGATGGLRPGPIKHTFVKRGKSHDRHMELTIEGFATNARLPNPDPVLMFQMHVAEGGPVISGQQGRGRLFGFNVGLPGLSWLLGTSKFDDEPELTYGHGRSTNSTSMTNLTETAGRLTQGTRIYLETSADMVWRITAVAQDKNLAHDGKVDYSGSILKVKKGIGFLRLEQPAVDPRGPAARPKDPDIVAVIGRRPATKPQTTAPGEGPPEAGPAPRTRLVRTVRATKRKDDNRMVPLLPLIPASGMVDRLYPVTVTSPRGTPDDSRPAAGEANPILDAVQDLVSDHAPALLDAHWTVEGSRRSRQLQGELQNVLNLQSLTMMFDLLLGQGLILTATQSLPLAHRQVQILLRGRRDPHNRTYVYLESVQGNSVRYHTRLGITNNAWSVARSGGTGSGAQQTGEPSVHNTTSPPGGGSAGPSGPAEGHFNNAAANPDGNVSQSTAKGGYEQQMAAQRDTLFIPGLAHRYGGDLQITASLTSIIMPSPTANALFNVPRYAASALQHASDQRRARPTVTVDLKERVRIPHALLHHLTEPEGPPGDIAAVEEISPRELLGPALNVTAEDLLARRVLSLGWDHEKLQVLSDEVMALLSGNELPASGERSHAVGRLLEPGRSRDAVLYDLSYPVFTRELFNLLPSGGMTLPPLARGGGPLTDTLGDLQIEVMFRKNPAKLGYFSGWVEAGSYDFEEFQQNLARTIGWSLGVNAGAGANTGHLDDTNPASSGKRIAGAALEPSVGSRLTRATDAVQQSMTRFDMVNRAGPWLRVAPDAIVTITLTARNERDWIKLSGLGTPIGAWIAGGKVTVRFLVRNAAELALSPEKSIDLGIYHPRGIPVGSGTFFPPPPARRPASTEDLVRAAFSVPFINGGFGVQADWDGHRFLAGDRGLDPAGLAAEITARLGELGPAPDPNLPDDEKPPPEPVRLENPGDPILLFAPHAGVIPPGHVIAPAQALADALGRPVMAPNASYRITRDGSVLVVRRTPDATAFGRGWEEGNFVVFFPSSQGRAPHNLPFNLADAVSAARRDLGWTLSLGTRPPLVPPPAHDVHHGVQTPESAIDEWRQGIAATRQLAAAARDLLPDPRAGEQEPGGLNALRSALDQADIAVRTVPAPPPALPAEAVERKAAWQDLARFQAAAADLGSAVAGVLTIALERWSARAADASSQAAAARGLLVRPGEQPSTLTAALGRLDGAAAVLQPPSLRPSTAVAVSDAAASIARLAARERDVSRALAGALTTAIGTWSVRVADARSLAEAARGLLPHTGGQESELRRGLLDAESAPLDHPARPPDTADGHAVMGEIRRAFGPVAALEEATSALLTTAVAAQGQQARVAAAADLAQAARMMLRWTGEQQPVLTARLDQADRELREATPGWWQAAVARRATAADADAAVRGLTGDERARVVRAAGHFESVAADVATAANQVADRLHRLRIMAGTLHGYTDIEGRAQLLELQATSIAPGWPDLRPGPQASAAQMLAATAKRVDELSHSSVQRVEDAIRDVITYAMNMWQPRRTAALALADRAWELLPDTREDMALAQPLDSAYYAARAAHIPQQAPATLEEVREAGEALLTVAARVTLLESAIRATLAATIDAPVRQTADGLARLSEEARLLLPYSGDRQTALEQQLRDAQPGLAIPAPLAPRPPGPDSVTEASSAKVTLDRLNDSRPAVAAAVAAVLDAGWRTRMEAVKGMTARARELLRLAGGRLPDDQRQILSLALNAADNLPEQGPDLPASAEIPEMDAVRQALASMTAVETAVGNVLTEIRGVLQARVTEDTALAQAARALLPYTGDEKASLDAELRGAEQAMSSLPAEPSVLTGPATAQALEAAWQSLTSARELEDVTRRVLVAAQTGQVDFRRRVDDAGWPLRRARCSRTQGNCRIGSSANWTRPPVCWSGAGPVGGRRVGRRRPRRRRRRRPGRRWPTSHRPGSSARSRTSSALWRRRSPPPHRTGSR